MTLTRPEETTLSAIFARRSKTAPRGVAKAVRQANARGATLGTGYLSLGAGVLVGIQALYGLSLFASHWEHYPSVWPAIGAWLLYLSVFAACSVAMSLLGDRVPHWLFATFLLMLSVVVALDFIAVWPLANIGEFATASVSAGFALVVMVTLRDGREVSVAAAALGIAFLVAIVLNTPLTTATIPAQVTTVALATLPALLGVFVVRGFRRMVQVELDRVLVQSTVSAPRFAVGMLASEELARLDLAAEELLDSVARGRTVSKLDPKTASLAASLATELRLHLIEGRRETWLFHAVTESELLGKSVTLVDRGSLAGLLDPTQRDGLLSAVWLLISDTAKKAAGRTVQITLGPVNTLAENLPPHKIEVPIVVTTTNVARNRVDPATWESIGRVGRYSDSTQNSILQVNIECLVDNPAEQ